jgi:hypothetical protein
MSTGIDRRDFLKTAATAGIGLGLGAELTACRAVSTQPYVGFAAPAIETVRVGFVGVGHQGSSHVRNFMRIPGVEIAVVCDLLEAHVEQIQQWLVADGRPRAKAYFGSHEDYIRMCEEEDLDLVFTATPWDYHHPVLKKAMETGKHAASEIPMAITLEQCWDLVETAERTRRHCIAMENCCCDRAELMILNMVRQGLFGDLLHAECGYLHDLRELKLSDFYVERWRIKHSERRNADLYPTHGLGPVTQWLDINRGNQADFLVAMASPSRGLNLYAAAKYGPESIEAQKRYALGDVVNTLIQTKRGETILITHNTDSPRPYSRRILLQGTRGLVRKYPEEKIYIEGINRGDAWDDLASWYEQWEHPLWKTMRERSTGAGHGGMDYIEDYRLVECLRQGEPTDMDVYDGAMWAAVIELSERSIARRSRPMDFPDFTRGAWQGRAPLGIIEG